MNDAEIERIAAEYIAEDWMLDRYYRNMNIIAFAKKLLERGYAEGRAAERIARRSADTDRHGSNELTSSPEPALRAADDLHQQILNLPCEVPGDEKTLNPVDSSWVDGFKNGHKAARHAAAELASGLLPVAREGLTQEALLNACLSYRHDFGLMPESERAMLMFEAGEWARAFGLKVEPTTTDATRAVLRAHLSSVAPASGDAPGEAK